MFFWFCRTFAGFQTPLPDRSRSSEFLGVVRKFLHEYCKSCAPRHVCHYYGVYYTAVSGGGKGQGGMPNNSTSY